MGSLLDALIQQESSGRPGILGPQTKYGRAQGLTQVLPATGAEMAQKLGVPWRPDLMTAKTDEGAAYQRQIGEAYLQEGIQKTGNTRDALKYYHGGPDRKQWGPKTNAYADAVLARQGDEQPMMPPQNTPPVFQGGMNQMPMPQDMLEHPAVASTPSLAGLMQIDPASLQPITPNVKPHAFDKGGKGWIIAGIIADAIAGGFGGKGGFAPAYQAQQQDDRQLAMWREKVAADRAERMQPQLREVGGALGLADPRTGQFTPTYQGAGQQPTEARDLAWWQSLSPEQQSNYLAMKDAQSPIAVTGPNGVFRVPREMGGRAPVRTGTDASGRKVVQYSDGTIDYAN